MAGPKAIFQIQRRTDASDGAGGFVTVWTDVENIRGTLTRVEGWEKFIGDSTRVSTTYILMMKYKDGLNITTKDRVRNGAKLYEIIAEPEDVALKNRFLQITLRKVE